MKKVIRDGKVAVLVSPGFGAGWSTWSTVRGHDTDLVFEPSVVTLVEDRDQGKITNQQLVELVEAYCEKTYGPNEVYCGGVDDLEIVWVPEGTLFKITEYDGSESIEFKESQNWYVA